MPWTACSPLTWQVFEGSRNAAEIVIEAHSLKSSCAYLGALPLSEAARALETAARVAAEGKNPLGDLRPVFDALHAAWKEVRPAYERELDSTFSLKTS